MQTSKEVKKNTAQKAGILVHQDFFVSDSNLYDLLVRTIIKHADDEDHIDRMVETWIQNTRKTLHPSDVPLLAKATSHKKTVTLPDGCNYCQGLPHVSVDRPDGASGADRCPYCKRGEMLKAMDEENARKKARAAQQQSGEQAKSTLQELFDEAKKDAPAEDDGKKDDDGSSE